MVMKDELPPATVIELELPKEVNYQYGQINAKSNQWTIERRRDEEQIN